MNLTQKSEFEKYKNTKKYLVNQLEQQKLKQITKAWFVIGMGKTLSLTL